MNNKSHIRIEALTKDLFNARWSEISLLESMSGLNPAWDKDNYSSDLPAKWSRSKLLLADETAIGIGIISEKSNACAHLHRIIIDPNMREGGLGAQLMRVMMNELSNDYTYMTLYVKSDNAQAVNLYNKMGFTPIQRDSTNELQICNLELYQCRLTKD
jgi:ribosomal protein S18 acetylase RimI-like enzyme